MLPNSNISCNVENTSALTVNSAGSSWGISDKGICRLSPDDGSLKDTCLRNMSHSLL